MLCFVAKKTKKYFLQTEDAFTLIEMLITIAILAIVVGVGFLSLANYKSKNTFDLDAQNVLEAIRNGENKALLGADGTGWGIKFTSDANDGYYEIFSGSSYATSSVVTRETLTGSTLFANPPAGYSKTITFAPLTGVPSEAESVVLKRAGGTDRYLISLSTLGSLDKVYEQGLVGYWPLDEGLGTTAYDASGGGNNGTITGATWQNVSACRIGQCLSFNGTSNYVSIAANMANSNMTFTGWINTTNAAGYVATEGIINSGIRFNLYFSGGKLYWGCYNGGWVNIPSDNTIPTNSWVYIAGVIDGGVTGGVQLYINGIQQSSTGTIAACQPYGNLYLGAYIWPIGNYFNGLIDDVRIYNRALSATEIQQMYQRY